jgi:UDP-N-acetylglucosamine--dolichyl-phosphate N-acetylglucosaminephosphotransferase
MVIFLELLQLAKITREKGAMIECNNLTLLNIILVYFGPMKEGSLAFSVMMVQSIGSGIAFVFLYALGTLG